MHFVWAQKRIEAEAKHWTTANSGFYLLVERIAGARIHTAIVFIWSFCIFEYKRTTNHSHSLFSIMLLCACMRVCFVLSGDGKTFAWKIQCPIRMVRTWKAIFTISIYLKLPTIKQQSLCLCLPCWSHIHGRHHHRTHRYGWFCPGNWFATATFNPWTITKPKNLWNENILICSSSLAVPGKESIKNFEKYCVSKVWINRAPTNTHTVLHSTTHPSIRNLLFFVLFDVVVLIPFLGHKGNLIQVFGNVSLLRRQIKPNTVIKVTSDLIDYRLLFVFES